MSMSLQKLIASSSIALLGSLSASHGFAATGDAVAPAGKSATLPPTQNIIAGSLAFNDGAFVTVSYLRTPLNFGAGTVTDFITSPVPCSGTIIPGPGLATGYASKRYVLTAKKCLPTATDSSNTRYKSFSVLFSTTFNATLGNKVASWTSTGGIVPYVSTKYDVTRFWAIDNDLAVLEVAADISASTPKLMVGGLAALNQTLTNYSYGQNTLTYSSYGTLRSSNYTVLDANETALALSPANASMYPCTGDIGSPLVATLNAKRQIFGVITTANCGAGGTVVTPASFARTNLANTTIQPTYVPVLQQLYFGFFGRPADVDGLDFYVRIFSQTSSPKTIEGWDAAYTTDATVKTIVDGFSNSVEAAAIFPPGTSNITFIQTVYQNIRKRAATTTEINKWNAVLASTTTPTNKGRVVLGIMSEVLATRLVADLTTIAKKTAVATNYTDTVARYGKKSIPSGTLSQTLIGNVSSTTDINVYQGSVDAGVRGL